MTARFLTDLRARQHPDTSADGRGTWWLDAPLAFRSEVLGAVVVVPSGFVTDFASVPRIPVVYLLAGNTAHAAAVIHDWLYTTHQTSRAQADDVFHEAMLAAGQPRWRAWLMWLGVRVGGAGSWEAAGPEQPYNVQRFMAP